MNLRHIVTITVIIDSEDTCDTTKRDIAGGYVVTKSGAVHSLENSMVTIVTMHNNDNTPPQTGVWGIL